MGIFVQGGYFMVLRCRSKGPVNLGASKVMLLAYTFTSHPGLRHKNCKVQSTPNS